jgi:hypothetical protein
MGRQAAVVLYVLALVAVVVGVDILFFRHQIWERLIVNVGIVLRTQMIGRLLAAHGCAACPGILSGVLVGVAAGGFLGDWTLSDAHPYAPFVPAAVTAVVMAIARVALKPRATSGPAGEQGLPVQQPVQ